VKKLSIDVSDKLATDIVAAVASGYYSPASEVVRDAFRYWKRERQAYLQRLRQLVEEGAASGEPVEGGFDAADIIDRGNARLSAKRQATANAGTNNRKQSENLN
jgi:putative addiction module CopG family antidote